MVFIAERWCINATRPTNISQRTDSILNQHPGTWHEHAGTRLSTGYLSMPKCQANISPTTQLYTSDNFTSSLQFIDQCTHLTQANAPNQLLYGPFHSRLTNPWIMLVNIHVVKISNKLLLIIIIDTNDICMYICRKEVII